MFAGDPAHFIITLSRVVIPALLPWSRLTQASRQPFGIGSASSPREYGRDCSPTMRQKLAVAMRLSAWDCGST